MIHGIFPVQFTCLTVFFHNLCPSFLWSTSPNDCLLYAAHAHTITTCFAVELRLCQLILVCQLFTWNSFILTSHILLTILISAHWSATSFSFYRPVLNFHAAYYFVHDCCTVSRLHLFISDKCLLVSIRPSWCHCHCHWLSLASVKSRLVLVPAHLGNPGQSPEHDADVTVPCLSQLNVWFVVTWQTLLLLSPSACFCSLYHQESRTTSAFGIVQVWQMHFYARQHICYSVYMPWQFHLSVRPSVCHTGGSVKNGWS